MTDTQLSQLTLLRSLCHSVIDAGKKATAGPWESDNWGTTVQTGEQIICVATTANRDYDPDFIALTRNLSPAFAEMLLIALDALESSPLYHVHDLNRILQLIPTYDLTN